VEEEPSAASRDGAFDGEVHDVADAELVDGRRSNRTVAPLRARRREGTGRERRTTAPVEGRKADGDGLAGGGRQGWGW
jgi:hypothetical protein